MDLTAKLVSENRRWTEGTVDTIRVSVTRTDGTIDVADLTGIGFGTYYTDPAEWLTPINAAQVSPSVVTVELLVGSSVQPSGSPWVWVQVTQGSDIVACPARNARMDFTQAGFGAGDPPPADGGSTAYVVSFDGLQGSVTLAQLRTRLDPLYATDADITTAIQNLNLGDAATHASADFASSSALTTLSSTVAGKATPQDITDAITSLALGTTYTPQTRTVAGHPLTSNVTVTAADVGLSNVDNTADAAKPISTAAQSALAAKADLVAGLVPTSQIPALALTNAVAVANQAAMLALTTTQVQPGDVAVRADGAGSFILTASDPSVLGNWLRLNAPTDAVTTVNGQNGTVVLAKGDVGLGNVDNTSDANKPVSTATTTALALKADASTTTAALATKADATATTAALATKADATATTAALNARPTTATVQGIALVQTLIWS